jgi:hypothetical protein
MASMAFTTNEGRVRVDFFKPSGKWYGTASVDMSAHFKGVIGDCLREACVVEAARGEGSEWGHTFTPQDWVADGGTIVCLEPYHEHSHPLMIKTW